MNLHSVEIFARVVEAKSFSDAARRLGLSKSVVSKRVSELEAQLGVRLLNRTTRRLSLTEVGTAFYERCAHILNEAREAELVATRLHSEPRGTLKVNVPVGFGVWHIAPVLPEFLARYPELRVDMTFNDRTVDMADEGYDVSVSIVTKPDPRLAGRALSRIRKRVCAAPGYLKAHGTPATPDDLRAHQCLVYSYSTSPNEWCFTAGGEEIRVPIAGRVYLNNENALRHAVLGGLGLAILPTFMIGEDVRSGALELLMEPFALPEALLFAAYLPNRHLSRKVRVFVDFLADRFGRDFE
jgi:DNA-binding transcriptional LysR family regulator